MIRRFVDIGMTMCLLLLLPRRHRTIPLPAKWLV